MRQDDKEIHLHKSDILGTRIWAYWFFQNYLKILTKHHRCWVLREQRWSQGFCCPRREMFQKGGWGMIRAGTARNESNDTEKCWGRKGHRRGELRVNRWAGNKGNLSRMSWKRLWKVSCRSGAPQGMTGGQMLDRKTMAELKGEVGRRRELWEVLMKQNE